TPVYNQSPVTFALTFDSLLPLSQPSGPDKKKPLLRCLVRHYKTVAMDTQCEQATHTGNRIGSDRYNISHFRNSSSSHLQTGWQSAVFRAPSFKTIKTGSLRSASDQRLINSTGRKRTSVGADAIGINKPLDQ
ncbi:hypothetical protein GOODEAATRI_000031, partial [Goodea atripinnis]